MLKPLPFAVPGGVVEAVVIGGSLGAMEALAALLPLAHRDTRAAIVVVVHLPPARPNLLPDLFRPKVRLPVAEPVDKEPATGGTIWFAPPGYHLLIERDRHFALSVEPPVWFSRPSIDVLFESAADVYGTHLVGIVLTGANEDGAAGALAVREAGGVVMVQDPAGAEAERMPSAAIASARPQVVGSIAQIGEFLHILTGGIA